MIQANELRIGNLINMAEGSGIKRAGTWRWVTARIIADIASGNNKNYEPIPLTEERLLKFGFVNDGVYEHKMWTMRGDEPGNYDGATRYIKNGTVVFFLHNKFYYQLSSFCDDYGFEHTTKEVSFIHQLQNLYFYLDDEELATQEPPLTLGASE